MRPRSPAAGSTVLAALVLLGACSRSIGGTDLTPNAAGPGPVDGGSGSSATDTDTHTGTGADTDTDVDTNFDEPAGLDGQSGAPAGGGPFDMPGMSDGPGMPGVPGTPLTDGEPFPIALMPAVDDAFEALHQPDFEESPQALAEQSCGWTFAIDEVLDVDLPVNHYGDEVRGTASITELRAFDADGRLLVIERATDDDIGVLPPNPVRTQLEYDDEGRVILVREGIVNADLEGKIGTVIELTHEDDGSFVAQMATTRVLLEGSLPFEPQGFCQRLELDASGRLLRSSFGCGVPQLAREYRYDESGALDEVVGTRVQTFKKGLLLSRSFGEAEHWTVHWDRSVAGEVTVTWNELDRRLDPPAPVNQRLLRTYDEQGRLLAEEFDYGDDGTFDERTTYRYGAEGHLPDRVAYDVRLDGIDDVVQQRLMEGASETLVHRQLAQWGDELSFQRENPLTFPVPSLEGHVAPQSVQALRLERDGEGVVTRAELTQRQVAQFTAEVTQRISIQTQAVHSDGYVEAVEVVEQRLTPDGSAVQIASRASRCSLTRACDGEAASSPPDPQHLACQSLSAIEADWPLTPHADPAWLPPPFDQNPFLVERARHLAKADLRPPTVREIVGY